LEEGPLVGTLQQELSCLQLTGKPVMVQRKKKPSGAQRKCLWKQKKHHITVKRPPEVFNIITKVFICNKYQELYCGLVLRRTTSLPPKLELELEVAYHVIVISLYALFLLVCREYFVVCMCLQMRLLDATGGAVIPHCYTLLL